MNRVAIIGTRGYPSYYGGFETAVRHIAPYLAVRDWHVTVYSRPTSQPELPHDQSLVESIETWGVEKKSLSTLSYGLSASLHAANRAKPDVALIMNVANGFWLPILRQRNIPTVVNVDGIEWEREKWNRAAKGVFHLGARATARFANDLIFDSKVIEARWNTEFRRSGNFIAYGGDSVVRKNLPPGLPMGPYVLLVARFVPENTVPQFFDAVERIARHWPVVLVGSEGYGGSLDLRAERLSAQFENVTWLGHVSDDDLLFSLWQNAGVYFHGHSVGGTNPALVQAMALGAPIVALDTPYNREVLGDSGQFTTPHPSEIARSILRIMSTKDVASRLGETAAKRALEHYAWDSICREYERVLLANLTV